MQCTAVQSRDMWYDYQTYGSLAGWYLMSNDIFFRRFVNLPCSFPSSVLIININGETQTQEIVSLGGDCHGYWDTTNQPASNILPLVSFTMPMSCREKLLLLIKTTADSSIYIKNCFSSQIHWTQVDHLFFINITGDSGVGLDAHLFDLLQGALKIEAY